MLPEFAARCRPRLPVSLAAFALVAACSTTAVRDTDETVPPSATAVRTTLDGAFTAAQAGRGRQVYDDYCAACHQADFYEAQLPIWEGTAVGEFLDALMATMPSENPGALATSQYVDVLAYIFSITGSPAGTQELTMGNADAIVIARD